MKQVIFSVFFIVGLLLGPVVSAQETVSMPTKQEIKQQKKAFQKRHKQIQQLVKQYKKATPEQQASLKAELESLVSSQIEEGFLYAEKRLNHEQAQLDAWKDKLQEDKKNISQIKAERVDDLLTGAAKQKYKAARKAWKKQLKQARKRLR